MLGVARLFWRTNRFEILAVLIAAVAAMIGAWLVTQRLLMLSPSDACLPLLSSGSTADQLQACPSLSEFVQYQQDTARPLLPAIGLVPIVAGALLGARLVAPEIEQRTAILAWSIVRSRRRWLLSRLVLPNGIILLVSVLLGLASERLARAMAPGVDVTASFEFNGALWPIIVARGQAGLLVGLLLGAVAGRTIPALISGIAVSIGLSAACTIVAIMPAERTLVDDPGGSRDARAIYVESVMRSADGRLVSFEEAASEAPPGLDLGDRADWVYTNFHAMAEIIPGTEARAAVARDVAEVVAICIVSGLLAAFVVGRRRPY